MAAADPLNANPTVLNPSDLPTRNSRPSLHSSKEARSILFGSQSSSSSDLSTPFSGAESISSDSDSNDDDVIEQIDEQEIFGRAQQTSR